jgi:hypothetical protein
MAEPTIVIQLVYSSSATIPFGAAALRELLTGARAHNTAAGISGVLLHVDGSFLQILEGPSTPVHWLLARIEADRRHRRVLTLVVRDITERNFPDWSMGFFDASGHAASVIGYRKTTGFADLMGDTATVLRVVTDFRDGRWRSQAA